MPVVSTAISKLKSKWGELHDLDRARAVHTIHRAGTSLNALAKALNRSPSLLRHLLNALKAPAEDRALALKGKISTNELVRRFKAAEARRVTEHNAQEGRKGCKAICDWLLAEGIPGSYGEAIVGEARRLLAVAESNRQLPKRTALPKLPVARIIKQCKPAEPEPEGAERISWLARWLARWAFYFMPDSDVRLKAIDLALQKQWTR